MIAIGADVPSQRAVSSSLQSPASRLSLTEGSVVFVQMDQQTIADYPVGGAATTPTFRYVYASYIDEPVVRKGPTSTSTVHFYHRNHQYSVTAITTSTGAIAERYAYTAYGQPTILNASGTPLSPQTSTLNSRYSYTGREWDSTLGLHHFRARWMSPGAGRFLGRDPIGYVDGRNQYASNLKLRKLDPTGLAAVTCSPKSFLPTGQLRKYALGVGYGGPVIGETNPSPINVDILFHLTCIEEQRGIFEYECKCPCGTHTVSSPGTRSRTLEDVFITGGVMTIGGDTAVGVHTGGVGISIYAIDPDDQPRADIKCNASYLQWPTTWEYPTKTFKCPSMFFWF